ncbi:MAG: hypothetical protein M3478_09015 [Planctomycetota bacterium]|nr:hypothetical protein [Planctomycetota bacterium]
MQTAIAPIQRTQNRWGVVVLLSVALAGGALAMRGLQDDVRPGHVMTYDGPAMPAAEPTAVDRASWAARWDAEVGLWWQHHPGHTGRVAELPAVHPAPSAAARLLLAAQARQLESVDVSAVLGALRRMQVLKGSSMHGCIRWYWEEKWPVDQNASFFTGLSLIALERCYADQLLPDQHAALREILKDLGTFFRAEADQREFFYPNRCLGDIVGAWLIGEIFAPEHPDAGADADAKLRLVMLDAAEYWETRGWGWGEHLSDTYAAVCLDNLSALLVLSQRLPDDVRTRYKRLFEGLLVIDDAFGGQARVPAIRSYAFGGGPTQTSYRDGVRPLADGVITALAPRTTPLMPPELGNVFQHRPPLGATLYERGWHDLAPPRSVQQRDVVIPSFDGVATARVEEDVRLGSLSRFPLMPEKENAEWGMSWQSFPVAMWRPGADWGFLQWESRSAQRIRAHPAIDLTNGYHDNALTTKESAVTVGRTFTIQRGGDIVALRVMPAIASEWDRIVDRWRVVDATADFVAPPPSIAGHAQLLLRYPQREVSVQCIPISRGATVGFGEATGDARIRDWGTSYNRKSLSKLRMVVVLWGISINGRVASAPVVCPITPATGEGRSDEERALEVHWSWPQTQWHLKIDPRDVRPLQELPSNSTLSAG